MNIARWFTKPAIHLLQSASAIICKLIFLYFDNSFNIAMNLMRLNHEANMNLWTNKSHTGNKNSKLRKKKFKKVKKNA